MAESYDEKEFDEDFDETVVDDESDTEPDEDSIYDDDEAYEEEWDGRGEGD